MSKPVSTASQSSCDRQLSLWGQGQSADIVIQDPQHCLPDLRIRHPSRHCSMRFNQSTTGSCLSRWRSTSHMEV